MHEDMVKEPGVNESFQVEEVKQLMEFKKRTAVGQPEIIARGYDKVDFLTTREIILKGRQNLYSSYKERVKTPDSSFLDDDDI